MNAYCRLPEIVDPQYGKRCLISDIIEPNYIQDEIQKEKNKKKMKKKTIFLIPIRIDYFICMYTVYLQYTSSINKQLLYHLRNYYWSIIFYNNL